MTTKRILRAEPLADFGPALAGWEAPMAFGVGYDGALYAVARRPSTEALTEQQGGAIFPKSVLVNPADYVVLRSHRGQLRTVEVRGVPIVVSFVQPFPGGLLLAGARCQWRPAGPEENVLVVDWNGRVERTFTIGDGVQDVRATPEGDVWVSYFDEGVFGNYGWNSPGPEPIGAHGLVGFDPRGSVRFTYDAAAAGTDWISDVYASNLDEDGALWVYFYSEFPIVRIVAGGYRMWKLGVAGARALAVHEGRALLFGDYSERSLGRLVALGSETAQVVEEVLVRDDRGRPLDAARVYGRGRSLFFLEGSRAFVLSDW
jgi:hypothetical protein